MIRYIKKNSVHIGMPLRTAQRYLRNITNKQLPTKQIMMFHIGRCGSSVLADQLVQHPHLAWYNELFEAMQPAYYKMSDKKRAYQRIADNLYAAQKPFYGFETKYLPEQHLRKELINKPIEEYLRMLDDFGFTHFILLDRNNYLRMAVSLEIGRRTQQWHSKEKAKQTQLTLDIKNIISYGESFTLIGFFEHLSEQKSRIIKALDNRSTLKLIYETHVEKDPRVGFKLICDFVGLEPFEADIRLVRQNPKPLRDILLNYDEVAQELADTPYEWMLEQ